VRRGGIFQVAKLNVGRPHRLRARSYVEISGGLALIGAVLAEFVAGTGGTQSGLTYRILESVYRLHIAKVFATPAPACRRRRKRASLT
jgi:hypothetical protein